MIQYHNFNDKPFYLYTVWEMRHSFSLSSQMGLRKYDEAATESQALMGKHGSDTRLLVLRARVLAAQGNATGATKHLQEALRVDPDCSQGKSVRDGWCRLIDTRLICVEQ